MNALAIYESYHEYRTGLTEGARQWQEYYVALRDTLHQELTDDGGSELVNVLLRSQEQEIQYLAAAAVNDCYHVLVLGESQVDVSRYIPAWGAEKRADWRAMERVQGHFPIRFDAALREKLRVLQSVARQMCDLRRSSIAQDEQKARERTYQSYRRLCAEQANQITELMQQVDTLRQEKASLENGYVSRQLEHKLAARQHALDTEYEQQRQRRRQEADEAFAQHFAHHLREMRQQQEEVSRQAMIHHEDRLAAHGQLHQEISASVRNLQTILAQQLNTWEQGLHQADYRFLAQCYQALHITATLEADKLLTGLQQTHGSDAAAQARAYTAGLSRELMQLEQAMLQLGLQAIRPRAGERFDPRMHRLPDGNNRGALPENAVVLTTEAPGIALAQAGMTRPEPLVQAVVTVRRERE